MVYNVLMSGIGQIMSLVIATTDRTKRNLLQSPAQLYAQHWKAELFSTPGIFDCSLICSLDLWVQWWYNPRRIIFGVKKASWLPRVSTAPVLGNFTKGNNPAIAKKLERSWVRSRFRDVFLTSLNGSGSQVQENRLGYALKTWDKTRYGSWNCTTTCTTANQGSSSRKPRAQAKHLC